MSDNNNNNNTNENNDYIDNDNIDNIKYKERIKNLLILAYELSCQNWNELSLDINNKLTYATSDLDTIIERLTSLLLIRCVTIVLCCTDTSTANNENPNNNNNNNINNNKNYKIIFKNLSTSNVAYELLNNLNSNINTNTNTNNNGNNSTSIIHFPYNIITNNIINELYKFIKKMIIGYKDNVPYHNKEHAYHVVLSTNKLIDMMLSNNNNIIPKYNFNNTTDCCTTNTDTNVNNTGPKRLPYYYVTYGLRHDPLALFSMMFASLIHDVEHQGIPNRQLAIEDDRLAVLYNDQSMAENYSLYIAFSELLHNDYNNLRNCILLKDNTNEYRRFRKIVIDLVLSTDIASPDRTQINKSKWKEAFGDPYETIERKLRLASLHNSNPNNINYNNNNNNNSNNFNKNPQKRFSLTGRHISAPKRLSMLSTVSAVSFYQSDDTNNTNNLNGYDYDDSLSGTPDESESDSFDNHYTTSGSKTSEIINNKSIISNINIDSNNITTTTNNNKVIATRRGSMQGNFREKFERRLSASSIGNGTVNTAKYRQRLGILRTVDLSGETIETYTRSTSIRGLNGNNSNHDVPITNCNNQIIDTATGHTITSIRKDRLSNISQGSEDTAPIDNKIKNDTISLSKRKDDESIIGNVSTHTNQKHLDPTLNYDADEPDELKASVVMEVIMTAADVAHNLQGWDHMVKWSNRLYLELRKAYIAKRGTDPSEHWFENQIGFLESYLLPVAHRLEDTCVFDEYTIGQLFSTTVESNRDKWLTDGFDVTQKAIEDGIAKFPPS